MARLSHLRPGEAGLRDGGGSQWYEPDPEPLGAPFIVMSCIDGVAAPDYLPYTYGSWVTDLSVVEQQLVADTCIDILAGIHGIPLTIDVRSALAFPNNANTPLQQHVANERARYEWARGDLAFPTIEQAFAVLYAQWPAPESDACISWGDARLGNVLWKHVEPVAVLDWEMVALAPPEVDLGWMIYFADYFQRSAERQGRPGIPGFLARESVVARYERVSGRVVQDLDWFLLYAALRQALASIRTMGRAVHFGEVPVPTETEDLILDLSFLAEQIEMVASA